ncbi:Hypothetical predicted protein [Podarcis lilfordi]|uniref:Uncharacterized protein n=1 Tax=Podarcis lilfordi TaxID=74358 RepID=A0AA35KQ04_9SAUR|nr:Hypothetical predicted protein [Podarcis lilfordi]
MRARAHQPTRIHHRVVTEGGQRLQEWEKAKKKDDRGSHFLETRIKKRGEEKSTTAMNGLRHGSHLLHACPRASSSPTPGSAACAIHTQLRGALAVRTRQHDGSLPASLSLLRPFPPAADPRPALPSSAPRPGPAGPRGASHTHPGSRRTKLLSDARQGKRAKVGTTDRARNRVASSEDG